MVSLASITFFDRSARTGALSLRQNGRHASELPPWTASRAGTSVAAYALEEVDERNLFILADFRASAGEKRVQVRAVQAPAMLPIWRPDYLINPDLLYPPGYWYSSSAEYFAALEYRSYYIWWQSTFATMDNVLGQLEAREVEFKNGRATAVPFRLVNSKLRFRGVGVEDVNWRWQYRLSAASPWLHLGDTKHRVYTTLAAPTAPWGQPPLRPGEQLPWAELLEISCRWARGKRHSREVAASITEAVFHSGRFEYGCPIGALTMYGLLIGDGFDCTAFIERVQGGHGNGQYVNCTDCAIIVSTCANVLGCDLWQSRMGKYMPAFETNPIQAIGTTRVESPCGWGLGFTYHEVAWSGACWSNDEVYDACLRFPSESGLTLPKGMRFGEAGDGQYRDHLATPVSRQDCQPRPIERKRRVPF